MSKQISYATRDFQGLRNELVTLTKNYYPYLVKNFKDASIYSVLLDINAAVADNLHFHIDRVWQETMLDFAQQRQSLYHIAKTYGIRLPGVRPSVALCDFPITVDVRGDKEDVRYLGILKSGAQVSGGGQVFETIDDIDLLDLRTPAKTYDSAWMFDEIFSKDKKTITIYGNTHYDLFFEFKNYQQIFTSQFFY